METELAGAKPRINTVTTRGDNQVSEQNGLYTLYNRISNVNLH